MTRLFILAALLVTGSACCAAAHNPATDWFHRAGYGVFVHYLQDLQNEPQEIQSLGRKTSWDACVRAFDTSRFAAAMADAGAGYVIFTMHQRTRFLIAPNATFDRLTGYKPGEACATRDLVADLYKALHARHIPLMLYWTGDGPRTDAKAAAALGWKDPVPVDYVEKWASVVREYGERYKEKVAGWWVDGSYSFIGYDDAKLAIVADALKAGNPNRIVAFNPGVEDRVRPYSIHEDYTCGEQNRFLDIPVSRWVRGEQWHILSYLGFDRNGNYLGAGWGQAGVRYSKADLIEYVGEVNRAGGVVSIDVMLYRDGSLDRSQLEALKALRPGLAALKAQAPVPPGNLAFRKPARLLSLDGSHELPVNGGGGGQHMAKMGVDGRPDTTAVAAGEWAWAFEVDLLQPHPLRRVNVHFDPAGYPTRLRIAVSVDGKNWQTVSSASGLEGRPYACDFASTPAQFVRVCSEKPDGPDQKGSQMAVVELEVYE